MKVNAHPCFVVLGLLVRIASSTNSALWIRCSLPPRRIGASDSHSFEHYLRAMDLMLTPAGSYWGLRDIRDPPITDQRYRAVINLIRTVIPSQKILTVSGRFQETQIVCHTLAKILGRDILEDDQIQIAPEIAAQRYREEVAQVDKAFVLRPQG